MCACAHYFGGAPAPRIDLHACVRIIGRCCARASEQISTRRDVETCSPFGWSNYSTPADRRRPPPECDAIAERVNVVWYLIRRKEIRLNRREKKKTCELMVSLCWSAPAADCAQGQSTTAENKACTIMSTIDIITIITRGSYRPVRPVPGPHTHIDR